MKICLMGRGGSGKSTCLVLLSQALRKEGRDVCILDADSTNVGLHLALGMAMPPCPLVGYFGGMIFQGGMVTCPVDDPSVIENAEIDLDALPERFRQEDGHGITLLQTGKLADFGVGAGCDGPMIKLARDIRVHRGGQPVDLLVDFKAGLEDTSRGALVGMDAIVLVCDPSLAGIETAIALKRVLKAKAMGAEPSTAHLESPLMAELMRQLYHDWQVGELAVVLNQVSDAETEAYLRERLTAAGIEVIACVPDLKPVRDAWLHGDQLPDGDAARPLAPLVDKLTRTHAGVASS